MLLQWIAVATTGFYLGIALTYDMAWQQRRMAVVREQAKRRRAEGYKVNLAALFSWAWRTRARAFATAGVVALFWVMILIRPRLATS